MPQNQTPLATADSSQQWQQWDQQHVWHPYASAINPPVLFPVVGAEGVELELSDGRKLIDGMSSWWSAIHGYRNPALDKAAQAQLQHMSHVMFGGLSHEPAATLCKRLVDLTPAALSRVFISDSGSVAVEVAIKMAIQYWHAKGQPQKSKLLALRNGYHGDTFGAMATCDPVTGMHHLFSDVLPEHVFAPAPISPPGQTPAQEELDQLGEMIRQNKDTLAAVILEPIVQGAGGMRFYSADYLIAIRQFCDDYGVLLIHDEIATGFGRTGKLFACEHAGISPDIMCVGKALTGGYLSLAATLCSEDVAQGICEGEAGVFMHGPTFMGNPLACSIANASLELLLSQDWQANIARIESQLIEGLSPARDIPGVADVRCFGAIGVIELEQAVDMSIIQPRFVEQGIWIRPFGKLVYTMPPYIISEQQLQTLCHKMVSVIQDYLS
ncbi:adenosylmethionine--8-amino-7-oxononanoate transaminase [Spongiibacter sp. KMU-158]|uniref:Adenosylmethionine-8-amino-7-oxononanoate aminotransferase n=1 Tax=Spongiibacter pelagi TaxID=2760804 RepID=A0A927C1Y0_9GAMM|nr:adenosylmethionine--8-amino-7-oxononanoate transaminase [Spongiibacter pelagi]MBD2858532.1 adenosylmethionine--8-amino-7-oxononanoate transaminase [Spongiibacter pelagi]